MTEKLELCRLIVATPEMYKLQKDYLADEFLDYATRTKELLARIDGEE